MIEEISLQLLFNSECKCFLNIIHMAQPSMLQFDLTWWRENNINISFHKEVKITKRGFLIFIFSIFFDLKIHQISCCDFRNLQKKHWPVFSCSVNHYQTKAWIQALVSFLTVSSLSYLNHNAQASLNAMVKQAKLFCPLSCREDINTHHNHEQTPW